MNRDRAAASLRGALHLIDSNKQRPTPEVLKQIRQTVVDAMDVLREPDPFKKRVGLIVLMIQESTRVETTVRNGREIYRVTITDQLIYSRALAMAHELATHKELA